MVVVELLPHPEDSVITLARGSWAKYRNVTQRQPVHQTMTDSQALVIKTAVQYLQCLCHLSGIMQLFLVKYRVLGDISTSSKIVIPECYCRVEVQSISHGVDVESIVRTD